MVNKDYSFHGGGRRKRAIYCESRGALYWTNSDDVTICPPIIFFCFMERMYINTVFSVYVFPFMYDAFWLIDSSHILS